MNDTNKTVIEINGVKMEVDLRHAKRIENIMVGTRIKALRKTYSDSYEVLHGVVIGFEPFQKLPTIILAVAKIEYNGAKIEFIYYNAKTENVEIVIASDDDLVALDKADFCKSVDNEIAKKEVEIAELQNRKAYFLEKFKCYWQPIEQAVADATAP
jgi:hypothetical protein